MKLIERAGDFFYGALLIGGGPLCAFCGLFFLSDFFCGLAFRSYGQETIETASNACGFVSLCAVVVVFGLAIWRRVRRRILPIGWIALEILIGVVGAVLFFGLV